MIHPAPKTPDIDEDGSKYSQVTTNTIRATYSLWHIVYVFANICVGWNGITYDDECRLFLLLTLSLQQPAKCVPCVCQRKYSILVRLHIRRRQRRTQQSAFAPPTRRFFFKLILIGLRRRCR